MKKFIFLFVLILLSSAVFAENFIEDQMSFTKEGLAHQINVSAQGNLYGNIGWWVWALNSQYYAEATPGINYAPFPWVEIGIGYGIETADDPSRYGAYAWLGKNNF